METQNKKQDILKVLIVEDEHHAQKELKRLLNNSSHDFFIIDYIDSVEEAVSWIKNNPPPDLMFFDIQLADGLSFEIFNHVKINIPIIFTTAFDEYAIKAFKVNSIDYLLKPVKQEELNAAIEKFNNLKIDSPEEIGLRIEQIEKLLEINKPRYKSRFITKIGDQIKYIDVNDIAYFKAEDNDVLVITKNNNRYFMDYSLEQIIRMVDPDSFFRVNRTYIIQISSIKKMSKYFNSRIHLELEPDTDDEVLISRIKVPVFLNWIEK
jgi:DNA-binding LytR/AlgR family response regulator